MEQYIIKGGHPLVGEVEIGGAKNAALAILAASIMTDDTVLVDNLPDVNDINVLLDAITGIGASVRRVDRHTVKINGKNINSVDIRAGAISAADRLISISRGSGPWERMWRLNTGRLLRKQIAWWENIFILMW